MGPRERPRYPDDPKKESQKPLRSLGASSPTKLAPEA
jgi:hypothetical protein